MAGFEPKKLALLRILQILSPKNVRERFCRMLQDTLETYKKL